MEKEQFENYTGLLYCESCQKMVPKAHMNHRRVKPNYIVSKCNVDMWLDRHKNFALPSGFSLEEVKVALHYFIYQDVCYLNDLAQVLQKDIDVLISLYEQLNIKGKHVKIRLTCACCGKEIVKNPREYKIADNNYCSHECYAKDKIGKVAGEQNPNYKRISTTCTNCGAKIQVIPFDYQKRNQYGDNHNFCSQECYWQFRSKYYVQEKTYTYHHTYSPQEKESLRQGMLKRLNIEDRLNTKPQRIVDKILEHLEIKYEREKVFDYYAVDTYLSDYKGIIEVMGDYWHTNPLKYNKQSRKINSIQQKQLHKDKSKYSYISSHFNCPILYLWESDLKSNPEMCAKLIERFVDSIKRQEVLPNYHSFNWSYEKELSLNKSLIIPYQSRNIDEYRDLFLLQNA